MGIVLNDKNQPSRPIDDQCNWFCGPSDIESWGRAVNTLVNATTQLAGSASSSTPELSAAVQWAEANKPYGELGIGTFFGTKLLAVYGAAPPANKEVVADLAARAENGDTLLRRAQESLGVEPAQPGAQAGRTPNTSWGLAELLGLAGLAYAIYQGQRNGD